MPKGQVKLAGYRGRGVFATQYIKAGEVVEECHCIFLDSDRSSPLQKYVFRWDTDYQVLPLGYGAIYNHADNPNCVYEPDFNKRVMCFIAQENIAVDQEIFIYYGDNWFGSNGVEKYEPWSRTSIFKFIRENLALIGYSFGLLVVLYFLIFS